MTSCPHWVLWLAALSLLGCSESDLGGSGAATPSGGAGGVGGTGGTAVGGGGGSTGGGGSGPVEPPVDCTDQCSYVRPGATGDGTDWDNALDGLPTSLERGRVYLLADGDYGSRNFDDPPSGGEVIEVRKATEDDHGTDTGWQIDYGEGVALFSGVSFEQPDYVLTGTRGGGAGAWTEGQGIEIERTGSACTDNGSLITFSPGVSNVSVRHVHAHAANHDYPMNGVKGTGGNSNLHFAYNSIHHTFGPTFHIGSWSDVVIEHNHLAEVRSTGAGDPHCPHWHAEGISSIGANAGLTIRHNLWDRIGGTAVFAGVNQGSSTGWQIYGNTFARSVTTIYYYNDPNTTNEQTMDDLQFHHNNIVHMPGSSVGVVAIQAGSNNRAYNNIWYDNIANTFLFSGIEHDHNTFSENRRVEGCSPACDKDDEGTTDESAGQVGTGSPFVDAASDPTLADYHLAGATEPGATLPTPFDVDPDGVQRGTDGTWDRGVYELP